jgi:ABC-2 type transport system ATP-binding protein
MYVGRCSEGELRMQGHQKTIIVEGLKKDFGDFTAVNGVNFHVDQGEIFGFLGPNGSGKTTTIRMMLGILTPTAGDVHVLNIPVIKEPEALRSKVGYMSQQFSLYNDLTVEQNLRFYGTAYGLNNAQLRERMAAAVSLAGLEGREQMKTEALSGGWRQRLALSAAILHEPEVLFLDEPTAGVDPVSRREFWELLYQLVDEGVTVFVTTHYMDEAEHCHRLAFIQHGDLMAVGSPTDLRNSMMEGRIFEIQPSDTTEAVKTLRQAIEEGQLDAHGVELFGSSVHIVMQDVEEPELRIEKILENANVSVRTIRQVEPSLEDVFINCMR